MHNGLKPELEEIVGALRKGDGIIIKHEPNHIVDRTMGYVFKITPTPLRLTTGRNPSYLTGLMYHYDSFEDVLVVDPV